MTALAIFGGCLLIAGSIIAHALLRGRSTTDPAPDPTPQTDPESTQELAFNVTALAVLAPDDPALPDDAAQHIASVVADTVDHYASYLVARESGVDAQACARLREQMYDHLRESLTAPQLARALVMGLRPHARERAAALTAQFRDLPSTQES